MFFYTHQLWALKQEGDFFLLDKYYPKLPALHVSEPSKSEWAEKISLQSTNDFLNMLYEQKIGGSERP